MDLDVFINAIKLGRLSHDSQSNRYSFIYAKEGLTAQIGFHYRLISR